MSTLQQQPSPARYEDQHHQKNENNQEEEEREVAAVEEDLAPCAGTMVVALARAVLKHLSSRDGSNLCSEDLTMRSAVPADDQLSIALQEVSSPEHPLESRLFAGLSVLSKALDPHCFIGLVDPQVLSCFRLGSRTLALCELMRQPQENGSKRASEQFTEEELAVVESTVRCYMCVSLCALGGWERAHEISQAICDGDSSPFRDTAASRMFKVLVACVAQFQALTGEAVARRTGADSTSISGGAGGGTSARGGGGYATARTGASVNTGSTASEIDSFTVLNSVVTTLNQAKRWLNPDSPLESQMLHLTQMAVSAAVLTERTEAMVERVREQDAAAQRDQRRLFRKLRLSKDPGEMRNIQSAARDIGSAQDTELRRSVLGLHRIACSLWRVIADCCDEQQQQQQQQSSSPPTRSASVGKHETARITTATAVNAGCAVTAAECLRGLLLIRTVPLADRRLCNVLDLNVPVARSVVAALGDSSAWALHVRLTAILALLRHTDLPPPSPVAAWSISPDVLTGSWRPPAALVLRAREMVGEGGLANKPPPPSSRTTARTAAALSSRIRNDDEEEDDHDGDEKGAAAAAAANKNKNNTERSVAVADFSSDVMEALMMLDEVAIQRERIVTLGFGIAGGKRRGGGRKRSSSKERAATPSSSSSYFMPAQFDECEYLGGNSKVAALVDCLDNLIAASLPENQQNNASISTTTSESSSAAAAGSGGPLPPLAESQLGEAKRLRAMISQKVPVAEAVAAEQQRRKMSPRSGRSSPTAASVAAASGRNNNNNNNSPVAGVAASGSGLRVVRTPKLAVNPSGGVLKNGATIRFSLSKQFLDMVDRGTVEMLVSVSHGSTGAHGGGDPASRIFKSTDPHQAMPVNIGRFAPGWAEVHVILHDLSGRLQVAAKKGDDDADGGDEGEDGEPFAKTVLSVATARFYVVTHGPGDSKKKIR